MNAPRVEPLRPVITTDQIQKRVKELARQISDDYKGQTIQMLAVLENAFMFLADLVRAVEVPVVCQFIKPKYTRPPSGSSHEVMEIFFSHEPDIRGQHILLVEGLVHSGVTSEFLMSDLRSPRGGFGETGDPARPAGGAASAAAAGLFRISCRRDFSGRIRLGSGRTDQPESALFWRQQTQESQ